jgi:hypothetical protein
MENLQINLYEKQNAVIRTLDCTSVNKTKVIIENAAGQEILVLLLSNDASEYSISEKGITKFSKYIK